MAWNDLEEVADDWSPWKSCIYKAYKAKCYEEVAI